eukprot:CAMPEP_0174233484 /NCGR_PEP_ID=MMETSP0417-20130205/3506_1 /TAXON_ID=242541 /ORGANISM="Mayorella sp, Strain BSH-02190019" /LENGTH=700 /DNA_ID=CAMNT_0015311701 /DNA_START=243 /DNA_END=2345 /DNA_ORIENTATION=-
MFLYAFFTLVALFLAKVLLFPKRIAKKKAHRQPSTHYSAYSPPGEYFACEPDGELDLPKSAEGIASVERSTVFELFEKAVASHGDEPALRTETDDGQGWNVWTWKQHYDNSILAGRALLHLGVEPFDSVNIIGFNSPEWFWANLGAIACGGKAAGIYSTNGPEAIKYIVNHSHSKVVAVQNRAQLAKFESIRDEIPAVRALVMWEGTTNADDEAKFGRPVYDWKSFLALSKNVPEERVHDRLKAQRPGHCCTLIYTSGTTGDPKAVMISHDNLTWTSKLVLELVPGIGEHEEHWVSYLPLSHVAAQMLDIHGPIAATAFTKKPVCVSFALPTALRGTLGETLRKVRPTVFFGVPRVWEKIQEKMMEVGAQTTGLKKKIATFAKAQGAAYFAAEQVGSKTSHEPPFFFLANVLLKAIRARLGLDRCRFCFSGAAPITRQTLEYFGSLGIHIYQVYGMSECTGPCALGVPGQSTVGSAGPPCPGVDVKIDHREERDKPGEGEICYRGRNLFMGYMGNVPKTMESIDPEGYLRSGDVGRVDENGMLWITGRIKELIITAGGENIAPVPIEDHIKAELPGLSNCMMIGDKRKYNVVLVTVKTEPDQDGGFSDQLFAEATTVDSACKTVSDAITSAKWKEYIRNGIIKYNNTHAVSNAQKVQKFRICPEDFSVANGDLTPTLKLKRSVVAEKYADLIEDMYNSKE